MLLRGIRAISDYEKELQMALMNRRLRPEIETLFLMSSEAHSFLSSHIVKEVFRLGGKMTGLVPPSVEARLRKRLNTAAEVTGTKSQLLPKNKTPPTLTSSSSAMRKTDA